MGLHKGLWEAEAAYSVWPPGVLVQARALPGWHPSKKHTRCAGKHEGVEEASAEASAEQGPCRAYGVGIKLALLLVAGLEWAQDTV